MTQPRKRIIVLSDEATAFMNAPVVMPIIEDIYAISDKLAWVVVCTEFKRERAAADKLEEAKVAPFLPLERAYVRKEVVRTSMVAGIVKRQRTKTIRRPVDRPLFPGYLFAQVPLKEGRVPDLAASRVIGVDGVTGILGTENGPLPVPSDFVDLLRRQQGTGAFDRTNKKPDWAQKGCRVRVADGPFASFLATVEEHLPNDLLKVAVEIFGRQTPMTLEFAQVERDW